MTSSQVQSSENLFPYNAASPGTALKVSMYLLWDLAAVIHDYAWQKIILLFHLLCPLPFYQLLAAIYV